MYPIFYLPKGDYNDVESSSSLFAIRMGSKHLKNPGLNAGALGRVEGFGFGA